MPSYQSPGVYIEEISAGARPIQASGTSSTGFVGVLQIPTGFKRFTPEDSVGAMLVPVLGAARPLESWSYARAFFQLGWTRSGGSAQLDTEDDKMLDRFIPRLLPQFTVDPDRTSDQQIAFEKSATAALNALMKAATTAVDAAEADFVAKSKAADDAAKAAKADPTKAADKTTADNAKTASEAALATARSQRETLAAQGRIVQTAKDARGAAIKKELDAAAAAKAKNPALATDLDARVATLTAIESNLGKTPDEVKAASTAATSPLKEALAALSDTLAADVKELPNLRLDADKRLFNAVDVPTELANKTTRAHWGVSLAVASNPTSLIEALTPRAVRAAIPFDGEIPLGNLDYGVSLANVQTGMSGPASMVTGIDGFHAWRREFGRKLFLQLALCPADGVSPLAASAEHAAYAWEEISDAGKNAWHDWIRAQTGLRLLEISITGYFANGGAAAYIGMALEGQTQSRAPQSFLQSFFDTVGDVAIIVAPGLNAGWQKSILDYAGGGRGDIFAILDTPRYLLTDPPVGTNVNKADRTLEQDYCHYQLPELEFLKRPVAPALRHSPNDTAMDNCVARDNSGHGAAYAPWVIATNPIANGLEDAYVVAPPSGFIAGGYGFNDATAGVQKVPANQVLKGITDLVCAVTAQEQNPLNVKGINLVRHRPGGVLIWGGRTTSNDPLWRYVNKRRVFLYIERSIRDAVQWSVFLPNTDITRSDLRSSIAGFLYGQWQRGVLDGAKQGDAFTVQCDAGNNPMDSRREGYLFVDVGIQPPYPAEFVVIRFRSIA